MAAANPAPKPPAPVAPPPHAAPKPAAPTPITATAPPPRPPAQVPVPPKPVVAQSAPPAVVVPPPPRREPATPTPPAPKPVVAQATPPAILVAPPPPKPAAATPPKPSPAQDLVAAYRPPAEQCGPRPDLSEASLANATPAELAAAGRAFAPKATWLGCRDMWIRRYDATFGALQTQAGANLAAVPGGAALVQAHDASKRQVDEDMAQWQRYARAYQAAMTKSRPAPATGAPPTPR